VNRILGNHAAVVHQFDRLPATAKRRVSRILAENEGWKEDWYKTHSGRQ
jgi:hypothetical protein